MLELNMNEGKCFIDSNDLMLYEYFTIIVCEI